ncbi:ATP-binding protein [Methyloterricola oryzae]|jgi:serine/threonine-protein kinase RsbW|uniref:ATP-binding protein n=1 Tax=Methyloterricola oryzae TaxID=1495050 RepID=UPI0005EB5CE8|nr:ATP-binding protein [Methyloterricola oryzae]
MSRTTIDLEIVIPTHTRYLGMIGNIAEELAKGIPDFSGDREALAYDLNLVLTEALANAIEHASAETIRISIHLEDKNLRIQVHDRGGGFDLKQVQCPEPDALCERGRGIFLIRTFMDSVDYHKTANGNVLEMHKRLA